MKKSKEILKKLAKLEHLAENPVKFKKGDSVFLNIGGWIGIRDEPEALIKTKVLDTRLRFNHEFAKEYHYRWEYSMLTEYSKYEWVYCRLFTEEEAKKFKRTKIVLPVEKISVDEYFKIKKFD